jgi:hypothetical protein
MTHQRSTAISGIVAVALFVAGAALGIASHPSGSDRKVVAWWQDGGNRAHVWIGAALTALAIISFVWYASGLRETLRRTGSEGLAALAFGAALVFAALALVGDVFQLSIAAAIDFGSDFKLDPNTARLVDTFTYLPIFGGAMVLSLTPGAVSVGARRAGILPRWLCYAGYVVAPALLLSVILWGIPLALFGIWVVATSVVMLRRGAAAAAPDARAALAS